MRVYNERIRTTRTALESVIYADSAYAESFSSDLIETEGQHGPHKEYRMKSGILRLHLHQLQGLILPAEEPRFLRPSTA